MTRDRNGHERDERFEALYRKHYVRILRFCLVTFRLSEEDAADLAQEVFMRFYEAMDDYRGDAERAYLETIARNVAFNRIRYFNTAKRKAKVVSIDDLLPGQEPSAAQEADLAERQTSMLQEKRFRAAYAELPKGQRDCIRLRGNGLTYEQIAQLLQITLDAVKTRLREAKKALRSKLGDDAGPAALPDLEEES